MCTRYIKAQSQQLLRNRIVQLIYLPLRLWVWITLMLRLTYLRIHFLLHPQVNTFRAAQLQSLSRNISIPPALLSTAAVFSTTLWVPHVTVVVHTSCKITGCGTFAMCGSDGYCACTSIDTVPSATFSVDYSCIPKPASTDEQRVFWTINFFVYILSVVSTILAMLGLFVGDTLNNPVMQATLVQLLSINCCPRTRRRVTW